MTVVYVILWVLGMVAISYFAWRKSERDWEYMQESSRKHDEWMIQCGRDREKYEQMKAKNQGE